MTPYETLQAQLQGKPKTWLVTGVAGFIGSHLLETLLQLDQTVIGLDNFSTGYPSNLDQVQERVIEAQWSRFNFIHGDIRHMQVCRQACDGVDYVLHQAALGSVPRSLEDPLTTHQSNIDGFLNLLIAARDAGIDSFTYAASSSTYGDHPALPKVEHQIGKPLSPYAVTKYVNELYADVFATAYGLRSSGLRYFNVFGPRQDPGGAYAAVIPLWIASLIRGEPVFINGDGETTRDFCYVANVVQANLLAATRVHTTQHPTQCPPTGSEHTTGGVRPDPAPGDLHEVYNIAAGGRTSLNQLYRQMKDELAKLDPIISQGGEPRYRAFRPGDVRHSQADISKAGQQLGYRPTHDLSQGLQSAMPWYLDALRPGSVHGR